MLNLISTVNVLSFSIAYDLIVNSFYQANTRFNKIATFLIAFFIGIISVLLEVQSFNMMPVVLLSAACINREINSYRQSLFIAATSIIILSFLVLICGSTLLLMLKGNHNIEYNLLMCLFLIATGICFHIFSAKRVQNKYKLIKPVILFHTVYVEITILVFLSIIMPMALLINNSSIFQFVSYIVLGFIILFLLLSLFYNIFINHKKTVLENEKLADKIILEKHREILEFHHYYGKLYETISSMVEHGDLTQLRSYFKKYFSPISSDVKEKINQIESELIKGMLLGVITSLSKKQKELRNFEVFSVYGKWKTVGIEEMELFKILTIFIENAIEEIEGQENGYINIFLNQDTENTYIKIDNTVIREINVSEIYRNGYTSKIKHSGTGLYLAERIINKHPNIEHINYVKFNLFTQYLIIH